MLRPPSQPADEAPAPLGASSDVSDEALVAAARVDSRAFGQLYERYLAPVYRFCHLRLGSRPAAEDATADVFLKALAGLPGYRGGSFAAWLFRIARHVVIDAQRRQNRARPAGNTCDFGDRPLDLEAAVLARADVEALRQALGRLPEDQRTVLELQLAGWSGEQIAQALGKSVDAVKMLRYRAVTRLRTLLTAGAARDKESHDERA